MYLIQQYTTASGKNVFSAWLDSTPDRKAQARIGARLDRLEAGNFGDCKPVGGGVMELRINYGPGYRVYFSKVGREILLLLCGGDKRRQSADIAAAIEYLTDFKRRSKSHETESKCIARRRDAKKAETRPGICG